MRKSGLVSDNVNVATPQDLYDALDAEYHFDFDPCPLNAVAERTHPSGEWGQRNYVNPPFRDGKRFLEHNVSQLASGKLSVFLLPANFDTIYWDRYVYPYATDIRWLNSKVRFRGYDKPFPATLVLIEFDPNKPAAYKMGSSGSYRYATFSQTR